MDSKSNKYWKYIGGWDLGPCVYSDITNSLQNCVFDLILSKKIQKIILE